MANVWLEVRSCNDAEAREMDRETVLRFPALSEAFKVAEGAAGDTQREGGQHWEYSVRLAEKEIGEISSLFSRSVEKDDWRAILRAIDVNYNGRCYTLTLYVFKE